MDNLRHACVFVVSTVYCAVHALSGHWGDAATAFFAANYAWGYCRKAYVSYPL